MSKQYLCNLCNKVFNQKNDFTRHQNKKTSCITLTEMQQISQIKEFKINDKNTLIGIFKNCLNILRDGEGLICEKALRNLSYLLILKLLEPHFGGEINIDDYEYDFSHIEDEMIEKHKNKLLEIVRFSNLSNEKEDNYEYDDEKEEVDLDETQFNKYYNNQYYNIEVGFAELLKIVLPFLFRMQKISALPINYDMIVIYIFNKYSLKNYY